MQLESLLTSVSSNVRTYSICSSSFKFSSALFPPFYFFLFFPCFHYKYIVYSQLCRSKTIPNYIELSILSFLLEHLPFEQIEANWWRNAMSAAIVPPRNLKALSSSALITGKTEVVKEKRSKRKKE